MKRIGGVLPVLITPFTDRGDIDHDTLAKEIEWVVANGADGVVTGMVSEVLRLTGDERRQLGETVSAVAARLGVPAVLSCGAESTQAAARYARQAQDAGASALMAIPPLSVALDDRGISEYYRGILEATQVEVVIQDASGYVGRPISIAAQARLLDEFPDRVSFKPEAAPIGPRLSALRDATAGAARTFEGSAGAALVDSHRRGVIGTMPGADLTWAVAALWKALEARDLRSAEAISSPLKSVSALFSSVDSYVAIQKQILLDNGVFPSTAQRGPVDFVLDPESLSAVRYYLERLKEACGR